VKVTKLEGRTIVKSGTQWEEIIGYSRAVRRGGMIFVTGSIGINEDGTIPNGAGGQARRAVEIVNESVELLGGKLNDIVRLRVFLTNVDDWEEVGKVLSEHFREISPAVTILAVSNLVMPQGRVEIEADAVLDD